MSITIQSKRTTFRSCVFDDDAVEFWIDLQSGRRLNLGFNYPNEFDSDEEVASRTADHITELHSMLAELQIR